jgi:TIR domain
MPLKSVRSVGAVSSGMRSLKSKNCGFPDQPVRCCAGMRRRLWYSIAAGTEVQRPNICVECDDAPAPRPVLQDSGSDERRRTAEGLGNDPDAVLTEPEASILRRRFRIAGDTNRGRDRALIAESVLGITLLVLLWFALQARAEGASVRVKRFDQASLVPRHLVEAAAQTNGETAGRVRSGNVDLEPVTAESLNMGRREPEVGLAATCAPCRIFVGYAHKDRKFLERFKVHLKPLERIGLVERWDDTRLVAGKIWNLTIKNAIGQANVAVLLVSADYLASDYVNNEEMPLLLAAVKARGLIVMPVILKKCRYEKTPNLVQFAAVNKDLKPLVAMNPGEQEELWTRLVDEIEAIARAGGSAASTPSV